MSDPVFYHSGMSGFPGAGVRGLGGLTTILDACLVNGANVSTAVTLTQTGGVATATFAGNHNFSVSEGVEVSGATPSAYNGRTVVLAKTANSVSFAVDAGTPSPATGAVQIKHPGAGWTKSDLDNGVRVYRSATASGGMGHYLQIEDTNPYSDAFASVRVRAAREHSGVLDAAVLLTPAARVFVGNAGRWVLCADDRTAYLVLSGPAGGFDPQFVMGEATPLIDTDDGAWLSNAPSGADNVAAAHPLVYHAGSAAATAAHPLRLLSDCTGLTPYAAASAGLMGVVSVPGGETLLRDWQRKLTAPSPYTHGLELSPVPLVEQLASDGDRCRARRGSLRGVYHPEGRVPPAVFDGQGVAWLEHATISGTQRRVALVTCHLPGDPSHVAFDLTGPWS